MLESEIENLFRKLCKAKKILHRKVKWIGRRAAPDNYIAHNGNQLFVEFKAPGKKLQPHQAREVEKLREAGARVEVIDNKEDLQKLLGEIWN